MRTKIFFFSLLMGLVMVGNVQSAYAEGDNNTTKIKIPLIETVRCDVADDVVKADLYIYNMNGEQITEYAITERGETSVVIDGGSLNAGMYLYALIADGQVIDTKRMILTK